jgi:hypothetical protein
VSDPYEASNFVALCDVDAPPDTETVEIIREKVRKKDAELAARHAEYMARKNAPVETRS